MSTIGATWAIKDAETRRLSQRVEDARQEVKRRPTNENVQRLQDAISAARAEAGRQP